MPAMFSLDNFLCGECSDWWKNTWMTRDVIQGGGTFCPCSFFFVDDGVTAVLLLLDVLKELYDWSGGGKEAVVCRDHNGNVRFLPVKQIVREMPRGTVESRGVVVLVLLLVVLPSSC